MAKRSGCGTVVLAAVLVFVGYQVFVGDDGSLDCAEQAGAVAHAVTGGCPTDLVGAATDASWAGDRIAELGVRKGRGPTLGRYYDSSLEGRSISSGSDSAAEHAAEVLEEVGAPVDERGGYFTATHVEVKAAVQMCDDDEDVAVLVINNSLGPCPGEQGCRVTLSYALPEGARLTVWWPRPQRPLRTTFVGRPE